MEKLMAGNPPQQELKPVEAKKEGLQRWTKNGKIWLAGLIEKVRSRPKEVIEEVAEAPGQREELLDRSVQKTDEANPQPDLRVEVRKREGVYSRDFFPEASQKQIDIELQRLQEIQTKLQELMIRMTANIAVISPIVEQIREIDTTLARIERDNQAKTQQAEEDSLSVDYEEMGLKSRRFELQLQIDEYYDALARYRVQGYNNDLRCDELIDLESTALSTRAECKRILGIETESLSPNGKQEKMNALSEKICREQEYLNGKNLMSHVTGYRGLVNILGNGNLAARSVQARQGKSEVVTSFKEKGRSEEHQIVFDEFTARAAYAQGKDRKGRNRNDPVIIMMRSRDLMTGYQYMDSDGRHFFGRNHNEAAGQYDPFSAEATRENMVILVPSVYREDLVADLSEIAKTQGRTVQELFEARGVVFISQTDYTVSGGVFKGHIFTGGNISGEIGEEDRKVVEHLAEIGRSHLYDGTLSKVEGRVIPTQNTGEGAGGVEGKLYIFKTSGSETVITQLEKNYFAEIAKLISKPKLTLDDWQTIINNISWADANFGKLFQAQVGVAEGYKLRDHTLLGAEILETYFTPIEKPISNGLLRTIWLLHDIGKPEAVEKEGIAGVTKQHEYTLKRLAGIMGGLGFQESDIEIAQAVIDQDFIGNYLRISGTSPNTVAENMISRARNIGIDPRDYYGLVKTHYLIDAGSYTEKAGGQRALDNLFIFDDEAGRMSFSSYNNNDYKIKRLEELLEELLSKEKL